MGYCDAVPQRLSLSSARFVLHMSSRLMSHQGSFGVQMDGLQASTLIQQMYAPDDRPRIIAVSADTLQVPCPCCTTPAMALTQLLQTIYMCALEC
jgi:hypothetical protein